MRNIEKKARKTSKKIIFILIIIFGIIIAFIYKFKFFVNDNNLIVARLTTPKVGDTICFYEYGNFKISKITGIREDGTYITKIDGALYNDQSKLHDNDVKGVYLFQIKYIIGILKSKVTLAIFIIILLYLFFQVSGAKRKSNRRKVKKEEIT